MPELLIMRHAKSDWGAAVASDRERQLTRRGVKAAERMGRFLTAVGGPPDVVLSSPAVRARSTAELVVEAGAWDVGVAIVPTFYGGVWSDVVDGVRSAAAKADRVLVVGHEPTWSHLVAMLTGGGNVAMPTAAVACLDVLGRGWETLGPGCAELLWHVTPRILKAVM